MIKLRLPLKQIDVNQPFGVNYLNFYRNMGLVGHNGVDFRSFNGFNCYASHDGVVTWAGEDSGGGISVNLTSTLSGKGFYTVYYHLKEASVKVLDKVVAGQIIGRCDNTGKYTTGDHLHFGLKETFDGGTINKDNGYGGAIDPTPYFVEAFDGTTINNNDCYKSNAYHRYFRKDGRNLKNETAVLVSLIKYLKKIPSVEQINACVYGSWDRESVSNPVMRSLWAWITKGEFINGKKPFLD
jgi:murein DD-endopeptidase MepM/ murein hydrolase activator NlpD